MASEILVPAYFYPAGNDYWAQLSALAAAQPAIGIMNLSNGPNPTVDPNYSAAVSQFNAAGGTTVAYVYSSYGARNIAQVKADIDTYIAQYPEVKGFFIDEMSNLQADVAYYQELHDYIKNLSSTYKIIANPGANTLESYLATADVLVTFEGNTASYNAYHPEAWMRNYDASRFSHLVYGVNSDAAANTAAQHAESTGGGVLYITGDVLSPNPWDTLSSFYANKSITGGKRADVLSGVLGNDTISGGAGNDSLYGNYGNDQLLGGKGNDQLFGGAGNDILDGGAGKDKLFGGAGNDTYTVSLIRKGSASKGKAILEDQVLENAGEGTDTLKLTGNLKLKKITILTLQDNIENLDISQTGATKLYIVGNAANNALTGNAFGNIIEGGAGNDTIIAGAGNDTIVVDLGGDMLTGGSGSDLFIFKLNSVSSQPLIETITDFSSAELDKIDLFEIDANSTTSADDAFTFVSAFTNIAGQLRYDASTQALLADTNGDAQADFFINMWNVSNINASDFIL